MTPADFARSITPYQHRMGEKVGSDNFKYNFQVYQYIVKTRGMREMRGRGKSGWKRGANRRFVEAITNSDFQWKFSRSAGNLSDSVCFRELCFCPSPVLESARTKWHPGFALQCLGMTI